MLPELDSHAETIRTGPGKFLLYHSDLEQSFEIGAEEFFLLGLMNGRNTLEQIRLSFEQKYHEPLSSRYLKEFVNQLLSEGFLQDGKLDRRIKPVAHLPPVPEPLSRKDPGASLNHRFDLLALLTGWLISFSGALLVGAAAVIGGAGVLINFDVFLDEILRLQWKVPIPLILLALAVKLTLLDLPRALMYGVACRKFGGRIRGFKLVFYRWIFPAIVCDIGNTAESMPPKAWWILSGIRVWTVLAVAALFAIIWLLADPATQLREIALFVTFVGSINLFVVSIVFLPFDGHALLARALRVPHLYYRARAETLAWLAFKTAPEPLSEQQRFWFRLFGSISLLLTLFIQGLIIFGGFWWLSNRYEGAGALVAILAFAAWYWPSTREKLMQVSSFRWIVRGGGRPLTRWFIRLSLLAIVVALGFVPYNHEVGGQSRLLPYDQYGARTQLEDEIVAVNFKEGDWVEAGEVVARLSGRQINARVKAAEAERAQARAELEIMLTGTRNEELEIGRRKVRRAKLELDFRQSEFERADKLAQQNLTTDEVLELTRKQTQVALEDLRVAQSELVLLEEGVRSEVIRAQREKIKEIEARLELHRKDQQLLEIRSPISGRIVTPYLSERLGQITQSGDLIAVIQDTSRLIVEIAADEQTAALVQKGMDVKVRLTALDGELLRAKVTRLASTTEKEKLFSADPFRSDRELYIEQTLGFRDDEHMFRLYAELEEGPKDLIPGMTGYARIIIDEGILASALFRPIARFFRTEVWSWLP